MCVCLCDVLCGSQGSEALQPLSLPDLVDPSLVPLAFPLVLLFVKPQQLVEALPPAHAVPGAPHKLSYTAQAPRAADPGTAHIGLPALQTRFAQHYSQCTLTVACVGLDKALMLMERAPHSVRALQHMACWGLARASIDLDENTIVLSCVLPVFRPSTAVSSVTSSWMCSSPTLP